MKTEYDSRVDSGIGNIDCFCPPLIPCVARSTILALLAPTRLG
jgi:hypothetical protein